MRKDRVTAPLRIWNIVSSNKGQKALRFGQHTLRYSTLPQHFKRFLASSLDAPSSNYGWGLVPPSALRSLRAATSAAKKSAISRR